jgi:flavin reductase (DIM6/NTAB) family NADH-FMN oxidoreductase RutF
MIPFRAGIVMPEPAVPREVFRQVMLRYPSAVNVITALDSSGEPRGLTCSAVCSLSMEPPAILACLNERNGSLAAVRESGCFAVNLLRDDRGHVSDTFASPSPDKYRDLIWRPGPATGMPWLYDDALAYVECRLVADLTAGTHAILIGLVAGGIADSDGAGPLLYWDQQYGRWAKPEVAVSPA